MENSKTHTLLEEQIISETSNELKKNIDDLVRWLDGSLTYFIRSIKGLAELSRDKEMFRSYVTKRVLGNLTRLSEIADVFAKEDEEPTNTSNKGKKLILNAKNVDYKELARYYTSEIQTIIAANAEEMEKMRLRISILHYVSSSADEFGHAVFDYICHRILMSQTMEMEKKIAVMMCLIVAVRDHDYEEYGEYADSIKEVVEIMAVPVCMSITKDYEITNTPEDNNKDGNQES